MSALAPLVLGGVLLLLWGVSVSVKDSSLVDILWGPAFAILAWSSAATFGFSAAVIFLGALVTVWALRLGGYLAWRNLGHGEDRRYQAMRHKHGAAWWWKSLFLVFGLQGALAWFISLPVQLAISAQAELSAWVLPGALLFLTGLFFETVGDLQLAAFKKDPASKGQVMARGLWKYTRHPNYFGDFCVWWGLYGCAFALGAPLWTAVSPALMSFLLVRVSGVTLLEKDMHHRRPGYADYVKRTSAFFPQRPAPSGVK